MSSSDKNAPSNGEQDGDLVLRLYIAGVTPNSLRAIENLKALCARHFPDRCSLEIVDVLQEPLRALGDDILVTPTLVRLSPGARTQVIGDLSDEQKVLSGLSLSRGI